MNNLQVGTIESSNLDVICDLPHGSIIEPFLFIIYVNDLCNASKISESIIFTNDTNLFFSHKSIKELFHTFNSELNKVFEWFNANKSSLNKDQTTYILFHNIREKNYSTETSVIVH